MSDVKLVSVKNRNNGYTGYQIRENGINRNFAPGEVKNLPLEELQQLSYQPGGQYMLDNFLIIKDEDARNVLNLEVEPEYFYTEVEIKELLLNGSLDQLEDALNFAPGGVKDLIKKMAVELQVPDIRKRDLITEKTGFNVNNAINVNAIMDADDNSAEEAEQTTKRKATPIKVEEKPARKTTLASASKYKVAEK